MDALAESKDGFTTKGGVDKEWLEQTFSKVGEVIGESVKAGAECGSFGLQLVPNAFEVSSVCWREANWPLMLIIPRSLVWISC